MVKVKREWRRDILPSLELREHFSGEEVGVPVVVIDIGIPLLIPGEPSLQWQCGHSFRELFFFIAII